MRVKKKKEEDREFYLRRRAFQRKMALTSRRAIIRLSRLKLLFALSEGSQNRFLKYQAVQRSGHG